MTKENKRKSARWELAAATTFHPHETHEQDCVYLNRILHSRDSGRLQIHPVRFESGNYVLPITDRETGSTYHIPIPEETRNLPYLKRHFRDVDSSLVSTGEITDLVGKSAREAWEGVIELRKQYGNPKELQTYFEFNTQDGLIHGSELRTMILLNKYLAGRNARTLTFQEGMEEDRKGKLSNGVWRDFGCGVYSPESPNKELAEYFIREGNRRGFKLPLLIHPSALDLSENGIQVLFAEDFNPELVVSGEQSRAELKKFDCVGDSGARWLCRNSNGRWVADWSGLFNSNEICRADKIRGEAVAPKKRKK